MSDAGDVHVHSPQAAVRRVLGLEDQAVAGRWSGRAVRRGGVPVSLLLVAGN